MAKKDTARRRKKQSKVVEEDQVNNAEGTEIASPREQILQREEISEVEMKQDDEGDEEAVQINAAIKVKRKTPSVIVTWEDEDEEEENDETEKMTSAGDRVMGSVTRKRKADPKAKTSLSKKTKLVNDDFCLFIGNLNSSKTFDEINNMLAQYLMSQSLLFQDIRLDRSRKHAFVDMASQMDLAKALMLDGENFLDKPMKIAKAKAKNEQKVKVKAPPLDKKAKDARCLFLKNVPYNATKEDILKVFQKAVTVRFPDGAKAPNKGIAFVEFKNEAIPKRILEKNQTVKIQNRVLIVGGVGEEYLAGANKGVKDVLTCPAEARPSETLFVGNLSVNVKEKHLKKVFKKAVSINLPQTEGKPRRYAFVEFATVADAEEALESSQNKKICRTPIRIEFSNTKKRPKEPLGPSETLLVAGLAEKTTAETLKSAFEGALTARIPVNKETGLLHRFGFVDFESEESCKAAKAAMEDCEIDGTKVIIVYAKPKRDRGQKGVRRDLSGSSSGVGTDTQE